MPTVTLSNFWFWASNCMQTSFLDHLQRFVNVDKEKGREERERTCLRARSFKRPLKDVTFIQLDHSRSVEHVLIRFALARPYALLTEKVKNCVQTGHESCPGFQTAPLLTIPRGLFRLFFDCCSEFIGLDSETVENKAIWVGYSLPFPSTHCTTGFSRHMLIWVGDMKYIKMSRQ